MKVIGFIASPRKGGNTAWVVNKILDGAAEAGAQTQAFYASDLNISPCKGCLGCYKKDGCVIDDDMQSVYAAFKDADALVLGTPNYMGQMTAQAKTLLDRLSAQVSPRFSPKFKEANAGKKLILAFTQGNPDADKFKAYYDYTKEMFSILEFDVKDVIVIAGTRSVAVSEREGLSSEMQAVGLKLVGGVL